MATTPAVTSERGFAAEYARLEERILARDQIAASQVLYGLLKQGRPVTEIVVETVRTRAPTPHAPSHRGLDDGVVSFATNDPCLRSGRVGPPLASLVHPELSLLPLAQSVWYIPTGLDPWNQLLGRAPGHYTRLYEIAVNQAPPAPEVHWPEAEPLHIEGALGERLNHWLTLVQRGEVLTSYRVFLGLMADAPNRRQVLAQLAFAGLIDVQDRMLHNRSYTTGHKAYRARAGSSTRSRWPRPRSSWKRDTRTTSRCRSTATSTATRSGGSTIRSSTRGGFRSCSWRPPSSTGRPSTRPTHRTTAGRPSRRLQARSPGRRVSCSRGLTRRSSRSGPTRRLP